MRRLNGGISQLLCLVVEALLSDLLDGAGLSMSSVGISSNWYMILNIVIALSLILH